MFCWEPEGPYSYTKSTAIAPFWFSMEHCWIALAPFWHSADSLLPSESLFYANLVQIVSEYMILLYLKCDYYAFECSVSSNFAKETYSTSHKNADAGK